MENLLSLVRILDLNPKEEEKLINAKVGTEFEFYRTTDEDELLEIMILKIDNELYDYSIIGE